LEGNFKNEVRVEFFGDQLAVGKNKIYYIYNEFNSTEATGSNFLIETSHTGKVVNRLYPFNSSMDGAGYFYAGYMHCEFDGNIFINPPFVDTIFLVANDEQVYPSYVIDFGGNRIPTELRNNKQALLSGQHIDKSYLMYRMTTNGRILVFDYQQNRYQSIAVYDKLNKKLYSFRYMPEDFLNRVLRYGHFFAKDQDTIAWVIKPEFVAEMIEKYSDLFEKFRDINPEMHALFKGLKPTDNPVILYLQMK
jgi:hypothetical protein